MNLFTKERQAHRTRSCTRTRHPDLEDRFVGTKETAGERHTDVLDLVDADYYT